MKQIIYSCQRNFEIIEKSFYKGFGYCIVNYGTYPCCYVALESSHPYYEKFMDDINLQCHGGITFTDYGFDSRGGVNEVIFSDKLWVLGWDYGHCGDFMGYYMDSLYGLNKKQSVLLKSKKWTFEELLQDCKDVIEQLDFVKHPNRLYK